MLVLKHGAFIAGIREKAVQYSLAKIQGFHQTSSKAGSLEGTYCLILLNLYFYIDLAQLLRAFTWCDRVYAQKGIK